MHLNFVRMYEIDQTRIINLYMFSFDVENLLTNVPLNEIINMIFDQLLILPNSTSNWFN